MRHQLTGSVMLIKSEAQRGLRGPKLAALVPILGNHYRLTGLSATERMLLVSDGAITPLVEAFVQSKIRAVSLGDALIKPTSEILALFGRDDLGNVWDRECLLTNTETGQPYLFVQSYLDPTTLDQDTSERILKSDLGIGPIPSNRSLTPERELLGFCIETNGVHLGHFGRHRIRESLCKTYRILLGQRSSIVVTQKMPRSVFSDSLEAGTPRRAYTEYSAKNVYLGLGSNLGNRLHNLVHAANSLVGRGLELIQCSSIYETPAAGMSSAGAFLNAVLQMRGAFSFSYLLSAVQEVERELGRTGGKKWADRPIDIDILFSGATQLNEKELRIPHPLATQRSFVCVPLCEIAPELVDPESGARLSDLQSGVAGP
ncbi:2-amino-4-hydroxy-6-hydroxymethyldihydropteridine diphosphokinase [Bradyrhizobium sp. CCBAU 21362]|uniref:2-amino-4-hydroxy-6- hydroxymethyldihydropteridine diphosphokinase n=1 Tax=Bradyrhizobium sp. CCBAU 21362 TaxID=1325082 RepID=UPI002306C654|nr:2-amino-4-hydroxy-6-hydroxymethyldihydropteridine diphosphokinase [Bradyrhizobium sp. CCBAU 21362]